VARRFNEALKQGAYGKIPIHKHSKLSYLRRPSELLAGLRLALLPSGNSSKVALTTPDVAFCDDMLGRVSRSFAGVIRQLPKGLCLDVLIFYLVLRALDTVEDDMEAFRGGREEEKLDLLRRFHVVALGDDSWSMEGVGRGDEAELLRRFGSVARVFAGLPEASREVIADVTRRMGEGMAEFVGKDLGQGTTTVAEYNRYCHFVAGLVGEGLSRLFSATGCEDPSVGEARELSNSMGLFLQKTNIIRDYLEDLVDGRAFWPQEVWKGYAPSGHLYELSEEAARGRAVQCLNHLVTDAFELIPDCLEYMAQLHQPEVFRFCAIPQVMAIATLSELYANPRVFTGVVKIRKGMAAAIVLQSNNLTEVQAWFHRFARDVARRVPAGDPSAERTRAACRRAVELTASGARTAAATLGAGDFVAAVALAAAAHVLAHGGDGLPTVAVAGLSSVVVVCLAALMARFKAVVSAPGASSK